jgi:hypothetical protein
MKIENGLLFVAAQQLSGDPRYYQASAINACVPIRNLSHMKEHPHRGKVYTVLHLTNGDEIIADATIPDLIQLLTEARVMNLFGNITFNCFPDPEIVINGSELKAIWERTKNMAKVDFPKGGTVTGPISESAIV